MNHDKKVRLWLQQQSSVHPTHDICTFRYVSLGVLRHGKGDACLRKPLNEHVVEHRKHRVHAWGCAYACVYICIGVYVGPTRASIQQN